MTITKRAVSLLALSVWVATAVSAEGQSGSGGPASDIRLHAWEKQLILPQKVSARLDWAQRRLHPVGLRNLEKMGRRLAPAIASGSDFNSLREQAEYEVVMSYPGLKAMDVSEAAFIVMAMAAKDMDDDIRMIMVEIRAMTAAKEKLRELIKELNGWISQEMSKHAGSEDINNKRMAGSSAASRPAAKATAPPARRMTFETRTSPVLHLEYVKAPVVPPLPPRNPGLTTSGLKSLQDDIQSNLNGMNEMSEATSLRLQMTMDRRTKIIQTLSNMMKKLGSSQERLVQNIK